MQTFHLFEKLATPFGWAAAQGCWPLPRRPGSHRQEMLYSGTPEQRQRAVKVLTVKETCKKQNIVTNYVEC